jgi:hypothetical protein
MSFEDFCKLEARRFARLRKFAQLIDVDYRTARRYVDAGMPVVGVRGCALIVDIPAAIAWLKARRPLRPQPRRRGRPRNCDRAISKLT